MPLSIRPAQPSDLDTITDIWMQGWHDAHAAITPQALVRLRTPESFRERSQANMAQTWVADDGEVRGFHMLDGAEVNQFYVAKSARGSGVAAALMAHAEGVCAAAGHDVAWLGCAIGNSRAARFYEKCGWVNAGEFDMNLDTSAGSFNFTVWRFEKALT